MNYKCKARPINIPFHPYITMIWKDMKWAGPYQGHG